MLRVVFRQQRRAATHRQATACSANRASVGLPRKQNGKATTTVTLGCGSSKSITLTQVTRLHRKTLPPPPVPGSRRQGLPKALKNTPCFCRTTNSFERRPPGNLTWSLSIFVLKLFWGAKPAPQFLVPTAACSCFRNECILFLAPCTNFSFYDSEIATPVNLYFSICQ